MILSFLSFLASKLKLYLLIEKFLNRAFSASRSWVVFSPFHHLVRKMPTLIGADQTRVLEHV